ncbi:MAG: tRNA preQ1(34) S-adenosylmethionine ribosyltransferase-isomerase QueA [Chloroflexi bacterium]|nr:tRNA preQ1(34) S-adenosylmethionine ribosyltransferase-isomerase QueA [Chloroflexota bacterium]
MKLTDFDYHLPPERIAQHPVEPRDSSRLLVLHRDTGQLDHRIFHDLPNYLRPNDVLVLNQTRVIPARLHAIKAQTGGAVEILLLRQLEGEGRRWEALVGGKRVLTDTILKLTHDGKELIATVVGEEEGAKRIIEFSEPVHPYLNKLGEMPLPPYITAPLDDPERYQTVYARREGSAAAPTAGLHFTGDLLFKIQAMGVKLAYCTLHIGLDTFAPVKEENVADHKIHREYAELNADNARIINEAKLAGGRIIPVGTTSARTLETAAIRSAAFGSEMNDPDSIQNTLNNLAENVCPWRPVMAIQEETDLFITPGYRFRAVDAMVTNFHLPKSTLLMMISALVGREKLLATYQEAIAMEYRFFSFGDAMLIV